MVRGRVGSFESYCKHHLAPVLLAGVKVTCVHWPESLFGQGFHYRNVLTERGGLRVDWGLDRSKDHKDGEFTDMALMDGGFCQERRAKFRMHRNNPAMCLASVVVEGART
jgi:hypothetical protein